MVDTAGGVGLRDVEGTLILQTAGGRKEITLTKELLARWVPQIAIRPIPRVDIAHIVFEPAAPGSKVPAECLRFVRLREQARLLLYARAGDTVTFRVYYGRVARYAARPLPVRVVSPAGRTVASPQALIGQEAEVSFVAPETGVYSVTANPGANYLQVLSTSHPLVISGAGGSVDLYSTTGELFFWVPAGTKTFAVRISGEGVGEGVAAALVDPTGKVVEQADNIAAAYQFDVDLPRPSAGEAWSLRMSKPSLLVLEDVHVDLRGIPPLVAGCKEALLAPVAGSD